MIRSLVAAACSARSGLEYVLPAFAFMTDNLPSMQERCQALVLRPHGALGHLTDQWWARGDLNPHVLSDTGT
jgi:hypothetical protein